MREARRGIERFGGRGVKTEGVTEPAGAMVDVWEVNKAPRTAGSRDKRGQGSLAGYEPLVGFGGRCGLERG